MNCCADVWEERVNDGLHFISRFAYFREVANDITRQNELAIVRVEFEASFLVSLTGRCDGTQLGAGCHLGNAVNALAAPGEFAVAANPVERFSYLVRNGSVRPNDVVPVKANVSVAKHKTDAVAATSGIFVSHPVGRVVPILGGWFLRTLFKTKPSLLIF